MDAITRYLTPELLAIALLVAAVITVLAVLLVIVLASGRSRRQHQDRLRRVCTRSDTVARGNDLPLSVRKQEASGRLDKVLAGYLPKPEKLRQRLDQTGKSISPAIFAVSAVVVGVAAGLGVLVMLNLSPLISLVIGIGAGLLLPNMVVGSMVSRRRMSFIKNFPEGIDIIVRGLKAGLPVTESLAAVGREAPEPVAGVFREVSDKIRVGEPLEVAVGSASRTMDVPELKFLAITLSVQRETGGNLAETLANLSEILRKRRQMKLKVKAVSSEARASAMILGSLPFVMFGLIMVVSQDYIMQLFHDPRGHLMLAAGLASMGTGILVMMKMVRFEI